MDIRLKSKSTITSGGLGVETVASSQQERARSERRLFIRVSIGVLILAPVLILIGVLSSFSLMLGLMLVIGVLVAVARKPILGFYIVACCAVVFEQFSLSTPILTDSLPIYAWPPALAGLIERPIGFFMLYILAVIVIKRWLTRQQPLLRGGAMKGPLAFFLLCVGWALVHGLTSGGIVKIVVIEIRPFWYLFMCYVLAYNLLTEKRQIRNFLWFLILCSAFKSLQGVYVVLGPLHGDMKAQHDILGHEVSFFFVMVLLVLIAFFLQYRDKAQMWMIFLTLPTLLYSLEANQRRTDYVALIIGVGIVWVLAIVMNPQRRKRLLIILCTCGVLGVGYVFGFAHSGGVIGEPARAIYSVFHPEGADASSNAYRDVEDFDLLYTVKENPLGMGFGKKFLQPLPLAQLATDDPTAGGNPYEYIPHNTIYWIWMRMGYIGYFALWFLFGSLIIRGCIIVKQLKDRYLQMIGMILVGAIFMEVAVAFSDYQLYFFRNVIFLGLMMGMLLKLPEIEAKEEQEKREDPDHKLVPARTPVGSQRA